MSNTVKKDLLIVGNSVILSTGEAARQSGRHPSTISNAAKEGAFPNAFKVGVSWAIPMGDLEAWKKNRGESSF